MKASAIQATILGLIALSLPACSSTNAEEHEQAHQEHHRIIVTSPEVKDVVLTRPYVCQIHARRHIEVRALEEGYLEAIAVKEGQSVKQNDVLFRVVPALYKARYDAELAEADFARVEFVNTKRLRGQQVVSDQEVKLYEARLLRAQAKAKLAQAELGFTEVKARFDGIMGRLYEQQGSLVGKGDLLTTLSDNSLMWVYFNVPEVRYFEFKQREGGSKDPSRLELEDSRVELKLADGTIFKHDAGNVLTVEGQFNNKTGNLLFRADIPNPEGLLRHGQTGTVLIHRTLKNALVIPQRATFEHLEKRYVYVIDKDNVAHQRPITIEYEMDDIYLIKSGLEPGDKIVLEGIREVKVDEKVEEYEFEKPDDALSHQKFHAE